MKRSSTFIINLLSGLAAVGAAFFRSFAQATDTWVIDGIGFKSTIED